jgi:hypothetical protein
MENLLAQICTYLSLSMTNPNPAACNAALKASYTQSGGQSIYNTGESFYSKKAQDLIKDNINDKIIYSVIGLYVIQDTYKKQEVKLQTKCNMALCDTIGMDLTPVSQSYSLGWNWKF